MLSLLYIQANNVAVRWYVHCSTLFEWKMIFQLDGGSWCKGLDIEGNLVCFGRAPWTKWIWHDQIKGTAIATLFELFVSLFYCKTYPSNPSEQQKVWEKRLKIFELRCELPYFYRVNWQTTYKTMATLFNTACPNKVKIKYQYNVMWNIIVYIHNIHNWSL